ncbi:MAG TPA: tetratricopeptide repeat protein [Ignavibacteria bacterium]|nr:tetratricopeptide repeat protein [Ignavibacteria bacterium]
MINIPTGTVTFLFTDIVGSTKLAQRFPDKLQSILQKHNNVLTNSIESNGGFIFKKMGDAFFAGFHKPEDAIRAAYDAQKLFLKERGKDSEVKVRMGIHTGEAEYFEDDYKGYLTLTKVQRIMSVANGGQILLTKSSVNSLNDNITEEIGFRHLGERRLKDLNNPEHIYQLVAKNLLSEFPPIKTLDVRISNLPYQTNTFIGRKNETKDINIRLKNFHLVTIVGPGGAGKSRFSQHIAAGFIDEFKDGVWWIDLSVLTNGAQLNQHVMNTLGIKEEGIKNLEITLTKYLSEMETVIVLDNCEHIVEECAAFVENLLSRCSNLKILATSREALKCKGESIYKLSSLSIPEQGEIISLNNSGQYESVELFVERATNVNPALKVTDENISDIGEICFKLDGIPLAIELAAARTKILSVEKIKERLNEKFRLLTGGSRTGFRRQQTLKATIDWSYDSLTATEKTLLKRLSVFAGSWTLEAAEEICHDKFLNQNDIMDLLQQLSEKSLINFQEHLERFNMLGLIRDYLNDCFTEEDETDAVENNYLKFYMNLSNAEVNLKFSDRENIYKIESEYNNLLHAITLSVKKNEFEKGLHIAAGLGNYWKIHGNMSEGMDRLNLLIQKTKDSSSLERAAGLYWYAYFLWRQGDLNKAKQLQLESLQICRELENKPGIRRSISNLSIINIGLGEYSHAEEFIKEIMSIAEKENNKLMLGSSLTNLGFLYFIKGEYEKSKQMYEKCLKLSLEGGNEIQIAISYINLAVLTRYQGDFTQSNIFSRLSLELSRKISDKKGISSSLLNIGHLNIASGNFKDAYMNLKESLNLTLELKDSLAIASVLIGFCGLFNLCDQNHTAVRLLGSIETSVISVGETLSRFEFPDYEKLTNELTLKLGAKEFNKYLSEGKKLSLEKAALLALSEEFLTT